MTSSEALAAALSLLVELHSPSKTIENSKFQAHEPRKRPTKHFKVETSTITASFTSENVFHDQLHLSPLQPLHYLICVDLPPALQQCS